MLKDQMEAIYRSTPLDNIPWNMEHPPEILKALVETGKIAPCKAIELGCGAGNYVIYLSGLGFDATGVDFSETAIALARKRAREKDAVCRFIVADMLGELTEIQETFDFAYDWELLHHVFPEDRKTYLQHVSGLLNPGGMYLSVFFSEQSPQFGGKGKYRKTPIDTELYFSSESEMAHLYDPLFETVSLRTVDIQGKFAPHKAICALLKKAV